MMNLITSEPEPDPQEEAARDRSRDSERGRDSARARSDRRTRPEIHDAESCLRGLSQLSGLLMMGLVKPAQANAMRPILTEILRYHQRNESRGNGRSVPDEDLHEIVRRDPRLLTLLEPFLSEAQIDLLMRGEDDADG